jgi:vacuolar-type H+-ATPase subunit D/Vma8
MSNAKKEALLKEIEDLSNELQEYMNDLKDEVDDAINEAQEIVDSNSTDTDRLLEIRNAISEVVSNQEQGLGI